MRSQTSPKKFSTRPPCVARRGLTHDGAATSREKPFYPSKVPRKGLAYCTMNPFPESKPAGNFDEVLKAQRAAAKAEREKITVPFRAVSTSKSLYQIPVMTHALNVHQDANLQLPSGTTNTTVAGEGK